MTQHRLRHKNAHFARFDMHFLISHAFLGPAFDKSFLAYFSTNWTFCLTSKYNSIQYLQVDVFADPIWTDYPSLTYNFQCQFVNPQVRGQPVQLNPSTLQYVKLPWESSATHYLSKQDKLSCLSVSYQWPDWSARQLVSIFFLLHGLIWSFI